MISILLCRNQKPSANEQEHKKIFVLLATITIAFNVVAPQLDVDSMKHVLTTQTDTAELKTLVNNAGYYQDNKIDCSLFYAKALT